MGTGKSKQYTYYDPTSNAQLIDQTKQYKVYQNQKGEQFQKYEVQKKSDHDFENKYQYRIKNSSPYLVDAYSAKTAQAAFNCTSSDRYQIVTQRIPMRLSDLKNLSTFQSLTFVKRALKGFQQIFKSQGVLLVKDTMIGINKQSNVKVWMNSNFALNSIEELPISYGVLPQQQKQSTMVDNIIEIVNSKTKKQQQWNNFIDDKSKQGRIGFEQAITLTETHLNQNKDLTLQQTPTSVNTNNKIQTLPARQSPPIRPNERIVHSPNLTPANLPYIPASIQVSAFSNTQPINYSPTGKPPTMSSLKNKIIHGQHPNNKVQSYQPNPNASFQKSKIQVNQPQIIQNTYQNKFVPRYSNNTILPPQQILLPQNQLRNANNFERRPGLSTDHSANLKPRSLSEGKTIVRIGNKTFGGNLPYSSFPFPSNNISHINASAVGPVIAPPFNQPPQNFKTSFAYQTGPQTNSSFNNQPFKSLQQPINNFSPQTLPQVIQNVTISTQNNQKTNIEINEQQNIAMSSSNNSQEHQQQQQIIKISSINQSFQNNSPPQQPVIQKKIQQKNQPQIIKSIQDDQPANLNEIQSYAQPNDGQLLLQKPQSQSLQCSYKTSEQIKSNQVDDISNKGHEANEQNGSELGYPVYMQDSLKNAKREVIQSIKHSTSGKQSHQKTQRSQQSKGNREINQEISQFQQYKQQTYQTKRKNEAIENIDNKMSSGKQQYITNPKNSDKLVIMTEVKDSPIQQYQTPVFKKQMMEHNKKCLFGTLNKNLEEQCQQQSQILDNFKIKYHYTPTSSNNLSNNVSNISNLSNISQQQQNQNKPQIIIKLHKQQKQQNKKTDKQQNGTNTKPIQKIQQKQLQLKKNQFSFKKAVNDSASNIRMETSKISIKSSADLKNIISYKDLRDLLQNVRRHQ